MVTFGAQCVAYRKLLDTSQGNASKITQPEKADSGHFCIMNFMDASSIIDLNDAKTGGGGRSIQKSHQKRKKKK